MTSVRSTYTHTVAVAHLYTGRLHVRYKVAVWLRGLISSPVMRAPMPKPRLAEIEMIKDSLLKANLSVVRGPPPLPPSMCTKAPVQIDDKAIQKVIADLNLVL